MKPSTGWFAVGAMAVIGGALLAWQQLQTVSVEKELAPLRVQAGELSRLQAENERLRRSQLPPAEVEILRAERAAADRLRSDVAGMRSQIEAAERAFADGSRSPVRFGVGSSVPAAEWKNAGAATPMATLESVLWAAAGGDVDAFAALLMIETGKTLPAARALLATLPEAMRAQYGTPEKLIAFLAIKDVPLGTANVRRWSADPADRIAQTSVVLEATDGKKKEANLAFVRQGEAWRLLVMEGVVAKYAAQLKGEPTTAR